MKFTAYYENNKLVWEYAKKFHDNMMGHWSRIRLHDTISGTARDRNGKDVRYVAFEYSSSVLGYIWWWIRGGRFIEKHFGWTGTKRKTLKY